MTKIVFAVAALQILMAIVILRMRRESMRDRRMVQTELAGIKSHLFEIDQEKIPVLPSVRVMGDEPVILKFPYREDPVEEKNEPTVW